MNKLLFFHVLIVVLLLLSSCAQEEKASDETTLTAAEALKKLYALEEDDFSKSELIQLCYDFAAKYPHSKEAFNAVDGMAYYAGSKSKEAIRLVKKIKPMLTHPDTLQKTNFLLCQMYEAVGEKSEFIICAAELLKNDLPFSKALELMSMSVSLETWNTLETYINKYESLANGEAFAKENADKPLKPERIAKAGRIRKSAILSYQGALLASKGEIDAAFNTLNKAEKLLIRNGMDQPLHAPQDYFRALAFLGKGETKKAKLYLAKSARDNDNKAAWEKLKVLYSASTGSLEGFEDYFIDLARKTTTILPEFNLEGYDSKQHSLSEMSGKATLVAFWAPT